MDPRAPATLKVWDRPVRLLHWTLVLAVALASLSIWWWGHLHQPAGYVALAAVLLRVVWGCVGSRYARWSQFLRSPSRTLAYAGLLWRGREPRYVGHNPLGAWMALALIVSVTGLALTGWLYTSDWFWGDETVENLHVALAWALAGLVTLHLAGVIFTSLRHRENLVGAMFSGRKPPAEKQDVA